MISIVRPSPLPDELAQGYLGAVMRYNGWENVRHARATLRTWLKCPGDVATVELLARVAGMETPRFVKDHTTLPLRRAVAQRLFTGLHATGEQIPLLKAWAMAESRPGAFFCASCVREDFEFHGTPYWRREHQMTGLFWCTKHEEALLFSNHREAFLSSPTDFESTHQIFDGQWVKSIQESAYIQRFVAICADLQARESPLDERCVSRSLREKAKELGLHYGVGVVAKGPLLSDLAQKIFNAEWLESTVPGIGRKGRGAYWHPMDGATSGQRAGVTPAAYAVAFACLFDSADEAVNAMVSRVGEPTSRGIRASATIKDDEIRQAYLDANANYAATAKRLSVSTSAVRGRLRELGLPSLSPSEIIDLQSAIDAKFSQGVPLEAAFALSGFSSKKTENILSVLLYPFKNMFASMSAGQSRAKKPKISKRKPTIPPRKMPSLAT